MFKLESNMSIKMKNKHTLLSVLAFTLFNIIGGNSFSANAAEDIDKVTMTISTKESKRGHRIHKPAREVILAYMIKKGDITAEEAEAHRIKRKIQRRELRALKKSGDINAFRARLTEVKAEHRIRRKKFEEYFKNNDELKIEIHEKRNERRERRKKERRDQQKEKK